MGQAVLIVFEFLFIKSISLSNKWFWNTKHGPRLVFILPCIPHSVHGHTSEPASISFGVPRWSDLGPVLFVLDTASFSNVVAVIKKLSVLYHSWLSAQKSACHHQSPGSPSHHAEVYWWCQNWVTENKLILDKDKTEAMIVSSGTKSRSLSSSFTESSLDSASVPMSDWIKHLGVTLDCHLTMKTHISNLVCSANFEVHHISSIHHLSTDATTVLFSAFVLWCLHCNSLLSISIRDAKSLKQCCLPCAECSQNWPYLLILLL